MAYFTPVYKRNNVSGHKLESYRPISAASVVCRTIENVMNRAIPKRLDTHALLSPAYVTFVPVEAVRLPISTQGQWQSRQCLTMRTHPVALHKSLRQGQSRHLTEETACWFLGKHFMLDYQTSSSTGNNVYTTAASPYKPYLLYYWEFHKAVFLTLHSSFCSSTTSFHT